MFESYRAPVDCTLNIPSSNLHQLPTQNVISLALEHRKGYFIFIYLAQLKDVGKLYFSFLISPIFYISCYEFLYPIPLNPYFSSLHWPLLCSFRQGCNFCDVPLGHTISQYLLIFMFDTNPFVPQSQVGILQRQTPFGICQKIPYQDLQYPSSQNSSQG